nr:hypothetical protein [Bacillus sp. CHD6a]
MPAYPTDKGNNTNVKVPDRKAEDWKDSNPKGYAQWFNDRSEQYWHVLMEKKASSIQPLPIDEDLNRKAPLKRAVQLIKRYRDIYFENDLEFAPISIVLTTLAGMYYNGEVSVNEAIDCILEKIILNIPQVGRMKVFNPTNKKEELSERWEGQPDLYERFLDFIHDFKQHWNKLNKLEGIKDVTTELKLMFGETIIEESLKEQAELVEKNRTANTLFIASSGILVAASKENTVQVRTNTFYGQ